MEASEKYTVKTDFLTSTHGKLPCVSCHGGSPDATDKEAAHEGVAVDPSQDAKKACASCHGQVVERNASSLHTTLRGFTSLMAARSEPSKVGSLEEPFENHCGKCHTTCGQCHVSRPTNLGGGLLSGHQFKKTPPIKDSCVACHATRVGPEYLGENEGVEGDVHWTQGGMICTKCHGSSLHGETGKEANRYDRAPSPDCLSCHEKVAAGKSGIPQHDLHGDKLACQVCHSVPYKNCSSCHVGIDPQNIKYFKTEGSEIGFKIGLNPIESAERPWKYVVLRHVPADAHAYDYYGKDLLPNFSELPTWKYATPHNIQRKTPQNSSCDSCHGNEELFLKTSDVKPEELDANKGVVVPSIPQKMGS